MNVDAVVLDVDGVLVDVADSYRRAIVESLESVYGETIPKAAIQQFKDAGGFNDDWATYAAALYPLGSREGMESDIGGSRMVSPSTVAAWMRRKRSSGSLSTMTLRRPSSTPGTLSDCGTCFSSCTSGATAIASWRSGTRDGDGGVRQRRAGAGRARDYRDAARALRRRRRHRATRRRGGHRDGPREPGRRRRVPVYDGRLGSGQAPPTRAPDRRRALRRRAGGVHGRYPSTISGRRSTPTPRTRAGCTTASGC